MKRNRRKMFLYQTPTSIASSIKGSSCHLKTARSARNEPETVSVVSEYQEEYQSSKRLSSGCNGEFLNGTVGKEPLKSMPHCSSRNDINGDSDTMKSTTEARNNDQVRYVQCSPCSSSEDDLSDVITVRFNSNRETMQCTHGVSEASRFLSEETDAKEIVEPGTSSVKKVSTTIEGYRVYTNACEEEEEELEIKQEPEESREYETEQIDYSSDSSGNSLRTDCASNRSSEVVSNLSPNHTSNLASKDSQILFSEPPSRFFCDYTLEKSDRDADQLRGLKKSFGFQQTKIQAPYIKLGSPVITGSFLNTSHEMNTEVTSSESKHNIHMSSKAQLYQNEEPGDSCEETMFFRTNIFKTLKKEIQEPEEGTSSQPQKRRKKINQILTLDTWAMYNYVIQEKSESEFECRNCKEIFTEKDEAVAHLDLHHPYKCGVCLETFKTFGLLLEHKRTVHNEIQYCNRCLYKTSFVSHLDKHIRENHKETRKRKPYEEICYLCGETCSSRELMDIHMMDQHGVEYLAREGEFKCPVCNHQTISFDQFKFHMLHHAGVYNYCPMEGCDFKNACMNRVQTHYEMVHLGVRKYPCPFSESEGCSFVGKRPPSLKTHLNVVHYKVRDFMCPQCPKAFMAKRHLTVHMRLHDDVKPIGCEHCDYRCCQKTSLNWHMKKHHPDQVMAVVKKECHNYKRGRKGKQSNKKPNNQHGNDCE